MAIDLDKVRITPEWEELERARLADARRRRLERAPKCVKCENPNQQLRPLHCTTCGTRAEYCQTCVAYPAGDVFCPWCADAYESAAEK